jgi:oligoribonuclease NrnB/cAMP/cGMP phosphodiesterase (DHH superfamily)
VNNTKRRRILSITHGQDVDSLFCDAILKNAFPDTLVFLTNYGYKDMVRAADMIKFNVGRSSKSGTIVFSDLTVNSDVDVEPIEEAATQLKSYGWVLVWLDHHSWREGVKRRVESFGTHII